MNDERIVFLEEYLKTIPIFLCNEDGRLLSFSQIGGDGDALMELVEKRKVFYSRFYKKRVTYMSNKLYWCVKPYKQRLEQLSTVSRDIFLFIDELGEATTAEIKNALFISSKTFSKSINKLSKELLVTAVAKNQEINNNWSSFYWGTYKLWEKTAVEYKPDYGEEYRLLEPFFSRKEIVNLLK